MVNPSISDFLKGSDILEKTNLKPVWETVKEYLFRAILIISSIITAIDASSKQARCIGNQTYTPTVTLTASEINYVGKLCYQKLDIQYRYTGHATLLWTAFMIMLCNSWKIVPSVRSGFLAVQDVNNKLGQQHLSWLRLHNLIRMPYSSKPVNQVKPYNRKNSAADLNNDNRKPANDLLHKSDDMRIARDCCRILFRREVNFAIPTCYILCNFLCLFAAIVSAYFIYTNWSTTDLLDSFECNIPDKSDYIKVENFSCSNDLVTETLPYVWVSQILYILLAIMNFISIIIAFHSCYITKPHEKSTPESKRLNKDYNFIKVFSSWSQKLNEQTSWLISSQYSIIENLDENHLLAIKMWDKEFLSLYMWMHQRGEKVILERLEKNQPQPSRDHVDSFPLLFRAAVLCQNYSFFMKLHEILIESHTGDSIFLSCGCQELKIGYDEAKSLLSDVVLQSTPPSKPINKNKFKAIEHIAYWLKKAENGLKIDQGLEKKIKEKYKDENLQNLIDCLKKSTLLTPDQASMMKPGTATNQKKKKR